MSQWKNIGVKYEGLRFDSSWGLGTFFPCSTFLISQSHIILLIFIIMVIDLPKLMIVKLILVSARGETNRFWLGISGCMQGI